jgi:hypothetical protein
MSKIDRGEFRDKLTLLSRTDQAVIDVIMSKCEPFFIRAEAGEYRFADPRDVKKRIVAEAVRSAAGARVRRIEVMSVSAPWDDWPPAFNDHVIKVSLHAFLNEGLMQKLWCKLEDVHMQTVRKVMIGTTTSMTGLERILQETLQKPLWRSIRASIRNENLWPDDLWRELYLCIHYCLIFYIGFKVSGMEDDAAKLEPMIDILPEVIPLGAKRFSKSTQVVFAA